MWSTVGDPSSAATEGTGCEPGPGSGCGVREERTRGRIAGGCVDIGNLGMVVRLKAFLGYPISRSAVWNSVAPLNRGLCADTRVGAMAKDPLKQSGGPEGRARWGNRESAGASLTPYTR